MIDKSILGYAALEYMSHIGKDIWDMYVPLVCEALVKSNPSQIDTVVIKKMLEDEYGIKKITYGAIDTIIGRMHSNGLIEPKDKHFAPIIDKIAQMKVGKTSQSIETEYSELCEAIHAYSAKFEIGIEITKNEIETTLDNFLDEYGGEIIIDRENFYTKLSKKEKKASVNYIISRYVLENQSTQSINTLEKLAKGAVLAQITSLDHFNEYQGKMKGVVIALDAPIIYSLLGLNGESAQLLNEELLSLLKKQGCEFVIFNQHYNEVHNTLAEAINRLITGVNDLRYASRVLRYAVREGLSSAQLQAKLELLENIMMNNSIKVSVAPDIQPKYIDIDVAALQEDIATLYNQAGGKMYDYTKERIANDADVISYIFRIRNNFAATNLKNCKAILITNNSAIAFASRKNTISQVKHNIPACVTDVFLSTILWLNYPQHNDSLNKKVLMDLCYSYTSLDNALLIRFYQDAKEKLGDDITTDETVLLIKSSKLALQLLEQKTLNNIDLYTDKTFDEIMQELLIRDEEEKQDLQNRIIKVESRIDSISKFITRGTFVVFEVTLYTLFVWAKFINFKEWDTCKHWMSNIACLIAILITALWGILSWNGRINSKINLMQKIESAIKKGFHNLFFK